MERSGLHMRPQTEQIVDYLTFHPEKDKFLNCAATLIRNHPSAMQPDFFGTQESLDTQWKEQQQRRAVAPAARQMGQRI